MNLYDSLNSTDPEARRSAEGFKNAYENGQTRPMRPFYDSKSKAKNVKRWLIYNKTLFLFHLERLIYGKKQTLTQIEGTRTFKTTRHR